MHLKQSRSQTRELALPLHKFIVWSSEITAGVLKKVTSSNLNQDAYDK